MSVVGVGAVLAVVVLLDEQGIHRGVGIYRERDEGHLGTLFHDLCVVNRIVGRCAPGEGAMIPDEYGRRVVGVNLADVQYLVNYYVARLQLVLAFHFLAGHVAGAGDVLVEVVGMCGSDVGNVAACLREGCGVGAVGVDDSPDVWEC